MTDSQRQERPGGNAAERTPSLLDASSDAYLEDLAALCPSAAEDWGIPGHEGELEDYSPEHYAQVADRKREMLADIDALEDGTDDNDDEDDFDETDQVTAALMRDRLCLDLDLYLAGENLRCLDVIASPVQDIRQTLQLMPGETAEQREALRSRLSLVPRALEGYKRSLADAASTGNVAAARQVDAVIDQCRDLAGAGSTLDTLPVAPEGEPAPAELATAKQAFGEFAEWLGERLAPQAPAEDGVGRERYERFSQYHVGSRVDLDEAYEWALDRLAMIESEQQAIAAELYGPGAGVREAMDRLNSEPRFVLHGVDTLREWMQNTADRAVEALSHEQFGIPDQLRRIECCIDPAGTGGIYSTPPTADLSRPGRMWWSVPSGVTEFYTWQELTTVFHEGVPGHHLQCGLAMTSPELNLWRRAACWLPVHGEGWALYAENLMRELGYHEDPGTLMGLLDAQRLRIARVALDIGVHLGKQVPGGTRRWDYAYARNFLAANTAMGSETVDFEVDRYLGWPGQAPSYALGQRLWLQLRESALAAGLTTREFHSRALAQGSMPMDLLRRCVLG